LIAINDEKKALGAAGGGRAEDAEGKGGIGEGKDLSLWGTEERRNHIDIITVEKKRQFSGREEA